MIFLLIGYMILSFLMIILSFINYNLAFIFFVYEEKETGSSCFPQEDGSCLDLEQEHLDGDPDEFM